MRKEKLKSDLLRKLYTGNCTRHEIEQLFDLLSYSREDPPTELMDEIWRHMEEPDRWVASRTDRIFARVEAATSQPSGSERHRASIISYRRRKNWMIAASLLVLVATATWWLGSILAYSNDLYSTDFGEIKELDLPDGTHVSLNGNSTLEIKGSWKEGEDRSVVLNGEAYFKVQKKPATNAKFSVLTPDVTVEVLGTSFNVNTHQSETRVFLEEGEINVMLEDNLDVIPLSPGQLLRYSAAERKLVPPREVEEDLEVSWKAGVMEFRNTPLNDILLRIADAHRLNFEIVDEALKMREFTLALPTGNMEITMQILSKTTGTLIEKRDQLYILRRKQEKETETEKEED